MKKREEIQLLWSRVEVEARKREELADVVEAMKQELTELRNWTNSFIRQVAGLRRDFDALAASGPEPEAESNPGQAAIDLLADKTKELLDKIPWAPGKDPNKVPDWVWESIPKWAKWAAIDYDGAVWLFKKKPSSKNGLWHDSPEIQFEGHYVGPIKAPDWTKSLTKRPKHMGGEA